MDNNNNINNNIDNNSTSNNHESVNSNVRVINTNGTNQNVYNTNLANSSNGGNIQEEVKTLSNEETSEPIVAPTNIVSPTKSTSDKKNKYGAQEIVMYTLMVIVIILIILLLLKFCSENSGKSIYKPSTTQNRMTTTKNKSVITESTTTTTQSSVIMEPTTGTSRPTVTVAIPTRSTRRTKTTTTVKNPVNPVQPVNPSQPTSSSTTTTTKKAAVYTYSFTKPTSETFAVNIYKDGQILSGDVYIWSMSDEFLSVGRVGPNAVVTITTASGDLSSHPKLKFSFQSDATTKYTMTYQN